MDREFFESRRQIVMENIGDDGIAVIPNAPVRQRNSDVSYPYRSDSDFFYLTGFSEPESVAVLAPGNESGDYVLFCRERNPHHERWEGKSAGLDGAMEIYGADCSMSIAQIDEEMPNLLKGRRTIHYCTGRYSEFDAQLLGWMNQVKKLVRTGLRIPSEIVDIGQILHEMRLYKTPFEIDVLHRVAKITGEAHCRAMWVCKPGLTEYEIQAEVEYWLQKHQCGTAYPSIVASGANACILHYTDNTKQLQSGELLLIDAGGELNNYAADVTRTFPVNGKFTGEQKAIYEIVLEAQRRAIETAVPGTPYDAVQKVSVAVISDGLKQLKILDGSLEEIVETKAYQEFYMHKIGHWLGLDVHDVGTYGDGNTSRILQKDMYMTVEPGIYVSPSDNVDARWHGIGIRIEDDVLLTEDGNLVTTSIAPKEIEDVEALLSEYEK